MQKLLSSTFWVVETEGDFFETHPEFSYTEWDLLPLPFSLPIPSFSGSGYSNYFESMSVEKSAN